MAELLELTGLSPFASRRVGQLSGGMLRRLGVAQALLNNPGLLILDEPTVGLDPAERINFRNLIGQLSRDRVVILSTHIVPDIGSSCTRLAVLDKGKVVFQGTRDDLVSRAAGKVWQVTVDDREYETLRRSYAVTSMVESGSGIETRLLADRPLEGWQPVRPNLEDAYLALIKGTPPHDPNS
jgi:ABC-2 type transport system ATP-binding protein